MRISPRFVSIADQGFNSVSNFVLVACIAITSTPSDFGEFSIAYALFVFLLGAQRALVGETALVHHSSATEPAGVTRRIITGAFAYVALPGAIALAVVGVVSPGDIRSIWLLLAVATVFALLQDALRYAALAEHRPTIALVLDAIWTIPATIAMIVLAIADAPAEWILIAWAVGAALAAVAGVIGMRVVPDPVAGFRWLRMRRGPALRYLSEFAALNGSTFVVWVALVPVIGAAGVGALRGAQLLFSPLNTLFTSVRIAMIPDLIRNRGQAVYPRRVAELGVVLAAAGAVWGGIVLLLGDDIGRALLGATWDGASGLRWAFFVQYLLMAAYTFVLTLFRVRKLDTSSTVMRGTLAVLTLLLPVGAGLLWITEGAAWGFAVAVGASAITGTVLLRRHPDTTSED